MRQASLFSMLHCKAASARSSALRLASSYEISSSSDGPGEDSTREGRAVEAAATAGGTLFTVVEICTCRMGATSDSALGAEGTLAADAFSLASETSAGVCLEHRS
jgi:hypothetical protein